MTKQLSISKAIRQRCVDCSPDGLVAVRKCTHKECSLLPFRMGKAPKGTGSRMKSVREYCRWCMNGSLKDIRTCDEKECELWPFRFGMGIKRAEKLVKKNGV